MDADAVPPASLSVRQRNYTWADLMKGFSFWTFFNVNVAAA
jgi:hypothetical protein